VLVTAKETGLGTARVRFLNMSLLESGMVLRNPVFDLTINSVTCTMISFASVSVATLEKV